MSSYPKFDRIRQRAAKNKGGDEAMMAQLPEVKTGNELATISDDRYLAEMTRRIFCAGFVWRVIDNKWPAFELAFEGFEPAIVAAWPDEKLEALAKDASIVRNYRKIASVRENAWFVLDIANEYGSFGRMVADWPETTLIDLWQLLSKRGNRLGGNSGAYFLRFMGKDCFLLTNDVTACLMNHGVIDRPNPTAKRDLQRIQDCFNAWHEQTGLPYSSLSRIAAYSVG